MFARVLPIFPLLVACASCPERSSAPEPKLVPAAGNMEMADLPFERNGASMAAISRARCDREEACGRLAPGRRFEGRNECLNSYNRRGYGGLESDTCGLIDKHALIQCLQTIETESCFTPIDDVDRLPACSTKKLCNQTGPKNEIPKSR